VHGRIGLIFNGVWSQYALATAPKYAPIYDLVYVHDLPDADLSRFDALVIPFQSHQAAIESHQRVLYEFLATHRKIAVFGDSTPHWIDAQWEDRPTNNYWWVTNPAQPPVTDTNYGHPVFQGLQPRHACWHTHGCYTRLPDQAEVIQRNGAGETITWETTRHGGVLFVSTLDPIVEHGIQQIRHLDHFVDNLTHWLCGVRPSGPFETPRENYGLTEWPAHATPAARHVR
jgi:hypothetical protein